MRHLIILTAAIFAVSATAAGAGKLITSKQIKNGTIKTVDLSSKAKRSLRGQDGRDGPRGLQGPAGPQGPAGVNQIRRAEGPTAVMGPDGSGAEVNGSQAVCPAGSTVVGGGWDGEAAPPVVATVAYNYGVPGGGAWNVVMVNQGVLSATFKAIVFCSAGGASIASARRPPSIRRLVERVRARMHP